MTQEGIGVNAEDTEAIAAYEAALRDFSIELNRLHIAHGAPSYAAIVKASVRPKLTKAGINEALSGKRLPSIDSLMEFVRVVSSPLPPPAKSLSSRCQPELAEAWRARWQQTKFAQRRAQAPWRRLRDTVRETLDEAYREAEAVRAAARAEADRIVAEAREFARMERQRVQWQAELQATPEAVLREAFLGAPAEPSTGSGVTLHQALGEPAAPGADDGTAGPTEGQATSDALSQRLYNRLDVEQIRTPDMAALRRGLRTAPGADDGTAGPTVGQATSDALSQRLYNRLDVEQIRTPDMAALRRGLRTAPSQAG
ncbi:hypothetical protein [Streptomyces sp. NPDC052693]|uniref:hypothetical protein n=1 Tax=Streptomyces sp. NPDC052693 TaxID=3155814 RepID=UPI0034287402